MGKSSSSKARVTEYRMSIHVGVGHALDAITEVRIDDKVAWSGNISTNTAVNINKPDLFGGQQKEGGLVGTMQVLMGKPDQVLPAAVAARYGRAPNDCPAFRGITTLFFHGNGVVSTGRSNDWSLLGFIIDAATGQPVYNADGFLWKSNTTFIVQKVEVTGIRAPKGLTSTYALSANGDANFAHIIYECLTNDEWGMGGLPSLIDKAAFEATAEKLAAENMYGSVWWMRQTEIEEFVVEMLNHIQATLFLNPNSGLLSIKLLRDDYDVSTLRHITPQNAVLSNFKRRSAGEIVNEMTVEFTNPETEQLEGITAQNIASIESQGGEKVSGNASYYAFRNKELATTALARDLRSSTAPLISADASLDRSAWDLLPGEVVLMSWPKRSTYSAVMRVGKVNYGKPTDSKIKTSLLQDVFSLAKPPIALLPDTEWPDPRVDPQPLTMQLFTVPAYFVQNAELQSVPVELEDSEALVGALADSETYDSFDYELVSETATATGDLVFTSKGAMSMTALAQLSATLPGQATSLLPMSLWPVLDEAPRVGGFVLIGYGDANQEFALVTGQLESGWTVARGVLDTVPKTWAAGTPLWAINPGAKIVDTQTIHGEGVTAIYRGLDRTARGLLGVENAPPVSVVVSNRPHLPIRPANVRVNGVRFGSFAIGDSSTVTISWATRNREFEDTQVMAWTDGPVQPEYRQETVVQVFDALTNTLIVEYGALWTDTQISFDKTAFDRFASVRFVVIARRDEAESLTGHAITVTGFANDPTAPLPPSAPPRQEPPSFYPAPAAGAFVCEASANVAKDGAQTPTLTFKGKQDLQEATHLTYRWRVAGENGNWYLGGVRRLNREYIEFSEPGVPGKTELEVSVAYVSDAGPGNWRNLPNVTTLAFVLGAGDPIWEDLYQSAKDGLKGAIEDAQALLEEERKREIGVADVLDRLGLGLLLDPIERTALIKSETLVEGVGPTGLPETLVQMRTRLVAADAANAASAAQALIDAKVYTDGLRNDAAITYATYTAMGSAISASAAQIRSGVTAEIADAVATLVSSAQLASSLAQAKGQWEAYATAAAANAVVGLVAASQLESALATAKGQWESYANAAASGAVVGLDTIAAREAALAAANLALRSYVTDYVTSATAGLAAIGDLNGVQAAAALALSVAQDAQAKLNEARLVLMAEASGSQPAFLGLQAGTNGGQAALVAPQVLLGTNSGGTIIPVIQLIDGLARVTSKLYVGMPGGGQVLLDAPAQRIDIFDPNGNLMFRAGKLT